MLFNALTICTAAVQIQLKFINYDQKPDNTSTFRYPSKVFTRRMKTSFLHPILGAVSNRCAKKSFWS